MAGRWRQQPITWGLYTGNLEADQVALLTDPIARGIESWAAACGVRIERYTGQTPEPDVGVVFEGLGLLELGLTDEPVNDPPGLLWMRLSPAITDTLQLEEVARHEFGHALGLDHAPAGVPSCMSAVLDERQTTQTAYDIAQAQALYGPPIGAAA